MKTTFFAIIIVVFGFNSYTYATDVNLHKYSIFQISDEEPESPSVLRKRLNLEFGYGIPGTALWTTPNILPIPDINEYPITFTAPFEFNQKENTPFYIGATYSFINHLEVGLHFNYSDFRFDNGYHLREKSQALKVRVSFYRNIGNYIEFYAGLGFGYRYSTYNIVYQDTQLYGSNRTENGNLLNPAFEMTTGFRVFLMPEIAWYVEAGINRSLLQTGMLIKFDFDN